MREKEKQRQGKGEHNLEATASHFNPPRPKPGNHNSTPSPPLFDKTPSPKKKHPIFFFFFANTLFCFSCFFSGTCLAKSPFACYNPLAFGRNRQATSNWIHTPQTGTRRAAEEKKRMEHQPTPQAGATFSNLRCRTSHLLRAKQPRFPFVSKTQKEGAFSPFLSRDG